jgi:hypothetical protein
MLPNRKIPKGGALILAGLAAFAYYKYSKMTPDQKNSLVGGIKEKGQKLFDEYAPQQVKDIFGNKGANTTANNGQGATTSSNTYGETNSYQG